jgi:molybdenum cofactor cytidylyltransferase
MVPAIVLAAGRSSRMGRPKALLTLGAAGPTFVERLTSTLTSGGAAEVLVVGRPEDVALATEVERLAAAGAAVRLVVNDDADRGQLSSVICGLNAADRPGVRAVLVMPVDAPLVRQETIAAALAVFHTRQPGLVRATYHGRHGHPVIFSRALFASLRHADPAVGARAVVREHTNDLVDLEVDDPGVMQDVDEPADYAQLLDDAADTSDR